LERRRDEADASSRRRAALSPAIMMGYAERSALASRSVLHHCRKESSSAMVSSRSMGSRTLEFGSTTS
jgi:hypothetical protein